MITNKNITNEKPFYKKYIIAAFPVLLLIILALIFSLSQWNPKPDPASEIVIRKAAADKLYKQTYIKKDPKDYRAYIDRGWVWQEKGEVEKAKADMEKAREIMAGK